jgi:hypothetical protein
MVIITTHFCVVIMKLSRLCLPNVSGALSVLVRKHKPFNCDSNLLLNNSYSGFIKAKVTEEVWVELHRLQSLYPGSASSSRRQDVIFFEQYKYSIKRIFRCVLKSLSMATHCAYWCVLIVNIRWVILCFVDSISRYVHVANLNNSHIFHILKWRIGIPVILNKPLFSTTHANCWIYKFLPPDYGQLAIPKHVEV